MFQANLMTFLVLINVAQNLPLGAVKSFFVFRNTFVLNGFLCSIEDSKEFIKEAMGYTKMTTAAFDSEISDLEFYRVFDTKHHRIGSFFDFSCETPKKVYFKLSQEMMLNLSNTILIHAPNDEAFSYMRGSNLQFDSDVAILSNGNIYDVYKPQTYLDLEYTRIGNWNQTDQLIEKKPPRVDLGGASVTAMIVLQGFRINGSNGQDQLLNFTFEPQLDVLTRYPFSVHKHLEYIYNFRINFTVTKDWGYYRKSTGHMDPGTMFSAIEKGEVDLGITISRMFAERQAIAFFTPPIRTFRTCLIFKHPSTLAAYTAFTMPFTSTSWACTFCMILISGLALRLIRNFDVADSPPNEPSFPASILLVIGTMCQQGLCTDSLRLPTRVLSLFLEMTSLLIYSYYGAEVVGFLLTPSPKTINTLDKLIESPIKMYAENLSYHRQHFTGNLNDKVTKTYYKGIKGPTPEQDRFINLSIGLKQVQKGGFALYGQDANMYTVIDKTFSNAEKCALSEIETLTFYSSTVIRKKSPFKETVYKGIAVIRESGLLLREDRQWHTQRPSCIGKEESSSVTLQATLVAQVIYALGVLFAIFFYFIEKRMSTFEKNKILPT